MGTAVIASLAATTLWIIAHLVAMRIKPAKNRLAAMFKAYLLSLPVLLAALAILNHDEQLVLSLNGREHALISWFYALVLELLFFFCFVECFYHIERAVTLRLLVEIQAIEKTGASIETIMKDYSVDEMVVRRLADLGRSGFVIKTGERFTLSAKGRLFAKAMTYSAWIFQSKAQHERL